MLTEIRHAFGKIKRNYFKSDKDYQIEMFITEAEFKDYEYIIPSVYIMRPSIDNEKNIVYELMIKSKLVDNSFMLDEFRRASTLCVPKGHIIIVYKPEEEIVGTFMLRHNFDGIHNSSAQLDWLVVDKHHRGNNFGLILSTTLVRQAFSCNYKRVFVGTDDYRLEAISIYLKLGFIPNLYNDNMVDRWQKIYNKLSYSYNPDEFITLKNINNIHTFLRK